LIVCSKLQQFLTPELDSRPQHINFSSPATLKMKTTTRSAKELFNLVQYSYYICKTLLKDQAHFATV
jgi:hypothetical protein